MKLKSLPSFRRVAPGDLDPGPARHTEEQIANLRAKVRRLGVYRPILVRDGNRIGAGRGLWEAAVAEGCEVVPVIDIEELSDADWERLAKTEDRHAEGGVWRGMDMELQPSAIGGFSAEEMAVAPSCIEPLFRA